MIRDNQVVSVIPAVQQNADESTIITRNGCFGPIRLSRRSHLAKMPRLRRQCDHAQRAGRSFNEFSPVFVHLFLPYRWIWYCDDVTARKTACHALSAEGTLKLIAVRILPFIASDMVPCINL